MAALTQDRQIPQRAIPGKTITGLSIAANSKIYGGSFVGVVAATGYVRALVAGDQFAGIARQLYDNTAPNTDAAAGSLSAQVESGHDVQQAVTNVASQADVGKRVYASDDNVLTLTATNNSLVGVITEWLTSTTCWVHLFTAAELSASN